MNLYPVALLVYNRLSHTKKVIEALKKNTLAKETELFIFADAPQKLSHNKTVHEVRNYLKTLKDSPDFKKVEVILAEKNQNIFKATVNAGNYLCENYEAFIGLEDDIITHPYFLEYMNNALNFYKDYPNVMTVMGYCHEPIFNRALKKYPYDVLFSYAFHSFGWGTWKDRWLNVDWTMSDYEEFKKKKWRGIFYSWGSLLAAKKEYKKSNKFQLWDIRLTYYMYMHDKLCVWPRYSYTRNIGFDGTGYHNLNFLKSYFAFPLNNSKKEISFIEPNTISTRFQIKMAFATASIWVKSFISNAYKLIGLALKKIILFPVRIFIRKQK